MNVEFLVGFMGNLYSCGHGCGAFCYNLPHQDGHLELEKTQTQSKLPGARIKARRQSTVDFWLELGRENG